MIFSSVICFSMVLLLIYNKVTTVYYGLLWFTMVYHTLSGTLSVKTGLIYLNGYVTYFM
jgi:hypothetical protein